MFSKKLTFYFIILYMFLSNNAIFLYANNLEEIANSEETILQNFIRDEMYNDKSVEIDNNELDLTSESCVLMDATNGMILYSKDYDRVLYPASTTKILTTLLAIEYGKFDEIITHSHNAVFNIGPGSSHIGMRENEQITLWQALEGIMLESANEVCMAVAEHIGGSVENFVDMMNKKAREVGAKDTHFNNPHGFHDQEHYTTAYDMAMIMKEAVKHEEFITLLSTVSSKIPPTNVVNEIRYLNNKNKMVKTWSPYYYENIVGGKTGFTNEAGNTLVSYAEKDGIKLITAVMKDVGAGTYTDTKSLFEYGFSQYENKQIFDASQYNKTISTVQTFNEKEIPIKEISVLAENNLKAQIPKSVNKEDIKQKISLIDKKEVPVNIGDVLGTIDFYYKGYAVGSVNLLAQESVESIPEDVLLRKENKEIFNQKVFFLFKVVGILLVTTLVVLITLFVLITKREKANRKKRRHRRAIRYPQNNHQQ